MKNKYIISVFMITIVMLLGACGSGSSTSKTSSKTEKAKEQVKVEAKVEDKNTDLTAKESSQAKTSEEVKKTTETTTSPVATPPVATAPVQKTQPVINPVSVGKNKIIVIDPGHANRSNMETEPLSPGSSVMKIKDGGGAEGITTKTPEYLVNMKVSLKLKNLLETAGYKVVMTKTDNSLSLGNVDRANIGNNANASLVIRIHADSSDNTGVTGASMLVPAAINDGTKAIHDESTRCGTIVLNTLTNEVGMKNRGVVEHSDMTGFNWSKVPVILIEMGFLSNSNEDVLLSSDEYENKLAKGLFDGIKSTGL